MRVTQFWLRAIEHANLSKIAVEYPFLHAVLCHENRLSNYQTIARKHELSTDLSTKTNQNVDNFVENIVFLCHREYTFLCNYMRNSLGKSQSIKIAIALVVALCVVTFCFSSPFVMSAVNQKRATKKVVVIDAGHGGADGGVCGVKSGVYEKEINLKTAICLGEIFKSLGFEVVYTRQTTRCAPLRAL